MSLPVLGAWDILKFQWVTDPGYVGKDYEELIFVLFTMIISMGLMVAFGAWWQR
jgi:hypothetical protein